MNDFSVKNYLAQIQHTLETMSRDMSQTKTEVKELHRAFDNALSQTKAEFNAQMNQQKIEFTSFKGEIKKDVEILAVRLGFIFAGASVIVSVIISLMLIFVSKTIGR